MEPHGLISRELELLFGLNPLACWENVAILIFTKPSICTLRHYGNGNMRGTDKSTISAVVSEFSTHRSN